MLKIIFFLLLFTQISYAQSTERGQQAISPNGLFFLRTVKFTNYWEDYTGKTIVFKNDSTKLYEIPISLESKGLFLSNDGQTIISIRNQGIIIYKKGQLYKKYARKDLTGCDDDIEDCDLFYTVDSSHFDNTNKKVVKSIAKNPLYRTQDSIFLFADKNKLIKISVQTGEFVSQPLLPITTNTLEGLETLPHLYFDIVCPSRYGLPNTIEGIDFEKALANFLNMRAESEMKNPDEYKISHIELLINLNTEGKVIKSKINGFDEFDKIDTNKVKEFLSMQIFEHKNIDKNLGEWYFSGYVSLINKNLRIAKKQKEDDIKRDREAYIKRLVADTINGIYIPKNIEECFLQLNKLLPTKVIKRIKEDRASSQIMAEYHFGLGMWLRNNWGLWGGSRLQQYMLDRGVQHPDDMSGKILDLYYDWLHDKHEGWKAFDEKK